MKKKLFLLVFMICAAMISVSAIAVFAGSDSSTENGSLKVGYAVSAAWNSIDTSKTGQEIAAAVGKPFILRVPDGAAVSVSDGTAAQMERTAAEKAISGLDASAAGDYYSVGTSSAGSVVISVRKDGETFSFTLKVSTVDPKKALSGTTGWVTVNGNKEYFYDSTHMYKNTFARIGNSTYGFDSNGYLRYGVFKYTNGCYYFSDLSTGEVATSAGWVENGNAKYYVRKGGKLYRSQFIHFGKRTYYYMGSNCAVVKGVFKSGGSCYYADTETGLVKKSAGWVSCNDNRYYASPGGAFYHNRFIKIDSNEYYYMNTDGSVVKHAFNYKGVTVSPDTTTGVISRTGYEKAIYAKSPYAYGDYVLIDISSQTLRYYKGGRLILKTAVVTGKNSTKTPLGKFRVVERSRNVKLTGPGYVSFVKYWMAFVGSSVGMHDASWRSTFGGNIYQRSGSHGCVNMPTAAAKALYSRVTLKKTIVIVRK